MNNQINRIKGYFISKCIYLIDKVVFQFKKDLSDDEPEFIVIFNDVITMDDTRLGNNVVEDYSINLDVGLRYSFMIRGKEELPSEYRQFVIFDKSQEQKVDTGLIKKPIINVIYKYFELTEDIYSYKDN